MNHLITLIGGSSNTKMIKEHIRKEIKNWMKNQVRYRIGGKRYFDNWIWIDRVCEERSTWLVESMSDFHIDRIIEIMEDFDARSKAIVGV